VKKKLTVLAFVGLAFLLLAGPVLAGSSRGARVISMTGTIKSVDKVKERIYVTIQMTNKPYLVKRGQTVWVEMGSKVVYYYWDGTRRTPYTFGQLKVDQKVAINAVVAGDTITARRVEVNKRGYK
jgi:hypothetical protein